MDLPHHPSIETSPPPFLYNPLKHHASYLRELVEKSGKDKKIEKEFEKAIALLRGTKTDLYTGKISLDDLYDMMWEELIRKEKSDETSYLQWMEENGGFVIIQLEDRSTWVLRKGFEPGKYIHLHPARNSENTFRLSINKLQTLLICALKFEDTEEFTRKKINRLREVLLQMSPVDHNRFNMKEFKKLYKKVFR